MRAGAPQTESYVQLARLLGPEVTTEERAQMVAHAESAQPSLARARLRIALAWQLRDGDPERYFEALHAANAEALVSDIG